MSIRSDNHPLRSAVLLCLGIAAAGAVAAAETVTEAPKEALVVSGNVALMNDYIWRGLSLTWGGAAVQVSIEADHASGAYIGFFGSNIAPQAQPNGNLEIDWTAGFRGKVGAAGYDVGAAYIYFPGANYDKASFSPAYESSSPNSVEIFGNLRYSIVNLRIARIPTKFFGWNVNNSGVGGVFNANQPQAGLIGSSRGAMNYDLTATQPVDDNWSVQAQVGHENIPHSHDVSWTYYSLGTDGKLGNGWTLGLEGWATSKPKALKDFGSLTNNGESSDVARATLVLTVGKAF